MPHWNSTRNWRKCRGSKHDLASVITPSLHLTYSYDLYTSDKVSRRSSYWSYLASRRPYPSIEGIGKERVTQTASHLVHSLLSNPPPSSYILVYRASDSLEQC